MPLLGLILAGLMISGLAGELPGFLRFSIVFALLSYLPGDVLVTRVLRIKIADAPMRFAAAFAAGLAFYSLVTWLCWMAGLGFRAYVGVLQTVTLAGWAAATIAQLLAKQALGSRPARLRGWPVVIIAGLAGLLFYLAPPPLTHQGDDFDHISYVRAIARENRIAPVGVLAPATGVVEATKSDPRKGTLHPLIAAACRISQTDPVEGWRALPVWLAPAAVMAFWAFATRLLPPGAYAPFALALFLMFQGGLGRLFLGNLGYGQHLALVFHWMLVAASIMFAQDSRRRFLVLILAVAAGAAALHIDALLHFGLFVATLVFCYRAFGLSGRSVAALALGAAVVGTTMLLWKVGTSVGAANPLHTHPQGLLYMGDIGSRWFVPSPVELLKRYGLLFLVGMMLVPALWLPRRHRRYAFMCLGLAAPPLLLAMNPWVAPVIFDRGTYLLHRFLLNVPVFAVTALLLGSLIEWSRRGRFLRKVVTFVVLVMWARIFMMSAGAWYTDIRAIDVARRPAAGVELSDVVAYLDDHAVSGAIILSDPITSYALTALTDTRAVAVLHQHATPNDPLAVERAAVVANAMSPYTLQADLFEAIRRFDVEYVVVNASPRGRSREFMAAWSPDVAGLLNEKIDTAPNALRLVFDQGGYRVYRVVGPAPSTDRWYPTIPFLCRQPSDLQSCDGVPFEAPLEIVGATFDPPLAIAGEDVRVTVVYRKNSTPDEGVGPLRLRIRLEDAAYFDSAAHYPGDKYVRRFRERRDARFRRFGFDRTPFAGVYDDSLWPIGQVICETFTMRLPTDLFEKEYDIRMRIDREPLVPNFALKDLLFNQDSHVAPACGHIAIKHPPGGIKHIE